MTALWRIELFGALCAQRAGQKVLRFRTQKAANLLGYMAFYLGQPHSREVLSESLWPESDVAASRHRLRMALSSLRHQLEPPGVPPGSVIVADRQRVQLNPEAIT